jgi:hypothetical protein
MHDPTGISLVVSMNILERAASDRYILTAMLATNNIEAEGVGFEHLERRIYLLPVKIY